MSFTAITLCVVSQRVFIFVSVYFVIDPVRKLLDTPLYLGTFRGIPQNFNRLDPTSGLLEKNLQVVRHSEGMRSGRVADHSPPCSTEAKNGWSYTSTPQYVYISGS
jgi:hypothetical protein